MKTKVQNWRNKQLKLVIDNPGVPSDEKPVLAVAEIYEGLGVWTLNDVRLSKFRQPSPYFNIGAEDYRSSYQAQNTKEFEFAKSLLRETWKPRDESENKLTWCTFDGIVRGQTPTQIGAQSIILKDTPIYFKRKDVDFKIKEMMDFWLQSGLDEKDPDISFKAGKIKIENPWAQPSQMTVAALVDKEFDNSNDFEEIKNPVKNRKTFVP